MTIFRGFLLPFFARSIDTKTVIACQNQLFASFGLSSYVHLDRAAAFTSSKLSSNFLRRGIACSRTSAYNAPGNDQCVRYNEIIWTTVRLALKSRNLYTRQRELVLPDTLQLIRSLLCTATNQTPHERLFNYQRKSSFGTSVPTWLDGKGPVFLKRHVRTSKYDPVVDEVKLVHATPNYRVVCIPSIGRETVVSLFDIAPSNSSVKPPFIRNDDIALTNFNEDPAIIFLIISNVKTVMLVTIPLV